MGDYDEYVRVLSEKPGEILSKESDRIEAAARILADATRAGRLIHVFGTGAHSSMAGEEMFLRPGGLMNINPIFDPGLSVQHGASRSFMIEKLTGYARPILDYYRTAPGDVMLVVNAYGINAVTIDAAMVAKEKGMTVIAVTSPAFSDFVPKDHPARHPCGKSLYELDEVDLVIDSHVPAGDAVIAIPGTDHVAGPVSTLCNCIVLGLLNAAAVKLLCDDGTVPDVIRSPYLPGGAAHNARMLEKHYERIRHI
jgi:uncharacterized phosphosugar-binding protein